MKNAMLKYVLQLADDSAILGQRLGEWCGHGPALELDMALTNVSLDLFGQARSLYQYAAELDGQGKSEDDMCFMRNPNEFLNNLLVELPNGDFAQTIIRQYLFDEFQLVQYQLLKSSNDERLAGIAEKSLKETVYHRRLSSEWVKRLGDGTEESHERAQNALNYIWPYTGSLFVPSEADSEAISLGFGADLNEIQAHWETSVKEILEAATLTIPENNWMQKGGKSPVHTEHLAFILAEMQMMQRAYPGAEW
jgi:ring-1,2-phenylacetyl-CoA epoxidase subunit PaaC